MTAQGRRLAIGVGVALAVLLVVLANVHLVYVSLASQPECVPHARLGETIGVSTAAKSACRAAE